MLSAIGRRTAGQASERVTQLDARVLLAADSVRVFLGIDKGANQQPAFHVPEMPLCTTCTASTVNATDGPWISLTGLDAVAAED